MREPIPFRRPVTRAGRAQVFAAADRALLAGSRPTQDAIRRDLGGGSLGSINTYLNEWYRELGSRLSDAERPALGVPAEANQLLQQLWRLAQASAHTSADSALDQVAQKIQEAERTALQAQNKALEILNAELQRHRLSAERSLTDARALLGRRETALDDERAARLQSEQARVQLLMELEVLKERRAVLAKPVAPAAARRIVGNQKPKKSPKKVSAKRGRATKSQSRVRNKKQAAKRIKVRQAAQSMRGILKSRPRVKSTVRRHRRR